MICKHCRKKFTEDKLIKVPAGNFCTKEHLIEYAVSNSKRLAKKGDRIQRAATRKAKDKLKSRSDWMREVQTVYNKFERLSRLGEPCYTCGAPDDGSRQFHCGHYLTRGARPEHRFNHDNTRKQCSRCNNFLSGNVAIFRIRLIEEIGIERVESMESDHEPKKYTIDDLKEMKSYYQKKLLKLS